MGIGKKICICKEYLRLEAKCNVISTGNNNTVCPCHTIEEVSSEATETTRTTVGLRRASVFLLMWHPPQGKKARPETCQWEGRAGKLWQSGGSAIWLTGVHKTQSGRLKLHG